MSRNRCTGPPLTGHMAVVEQNIRKNVFAQAEIPLDLSQWESFADSNMQEIVDGLEETVRIQFLIYRENHKRLGKYNG